MAENITEGDDKDTYVFLDFNGKLTNDVFESEVFLRIANLHTKNPLIQVNDGVFKGTYDYSIGTNLFFEEIEDTLPPGNAFEKEAPIQLKHTLSETKVIHFKPVKIPQQKTKIANEVNKIDFNLDWDYNTLLEKFDNGTLRLEDFVTNEHQNQELQTLENTEVEEVEEVNKQEIETVEAQTESRVKSEVYYKEEVQEEVIINDIMPVKILEAEYEKLNVLARRPVKRAASPELVAECDKIYEEAYDYHNIERQVLQPSDAFRIEEVTDINEATLSKCVDLDRCVLYGIIPPSSDIPRILSDEEKRKVLTLENFDNLSLAARYYVLKALVEDLELYVKSLPEHMLNDKDEFGRTPVQTLEIYKKLSKSVKNRIQEIKCS